MKQNNVINKVMLYFSLSIMTSAIGFITIPYLTRALRPEEYAMEGIMYSIIYVLTPLLSVSATGLVAINKTNFNFEEYSNFKSNYISLAVILLTIIEIVAFLFINIYPTYSLIIISAPIISFFMVLSDINSTELIQENKAKSFGTINLFLNILKLILSILFISIINFSWKGRILAILLSEFVFILIRIKYFSDKNYKFKFTISKYYFKEFLSYGLPLSLSIGAGWILNESGRFFILKYYSLTEAGYYSVATRIGALIVVLNNSLINGIYPTVYKHLKEKTIGNKIKKYTKNYLYLLMVTSLIIVSSVIFLGDIFLGKEYADGKKMICIILVAYMFSGLYRISGLVIDYYKKNIIKTILVYISALSYVSISFVGIKKIGVNITAIAMLLSYVLLFILTYYFSNKILKEEMINEKESN